MTPVEHAERLARTARNEHRIDELESTLRILAERITRLEWARPVPGPTADLTAVHDMLRERGIHLDDETIVAILDAAGGER